MCCDAALANDLFCSLFVISKLKLHMFSLVLICLAFDLTLFKWWAFKQLARAVLIGGGGGALCLLVSKTSTQGWQSICSGTEKYRVHIAGFAISKSQPLKSGLRFDFDESHSPSAYHTNA